MTTVNYELESLTLDEVKWMVISINNEIGRIYKQTSSLSKSDSLRHAKENEGYIQILLSAKTKLINSIT